MSPAASTRWCPTPEQVMILEEMYKGGVRTPNAAQIQQITSHLSLYGKIEGKNVFYWFQNHKARDRQKLRKRLLAKQVVLHHPNNHNPMIFHHHHDHHLPNINIDHHHPFQQPPHFLRQLHLDQPPPPPPPPRYAPPSFALHYPPPHPTSPPAFAAPQAMAEDHMDAFPRVTTTRYTWTAMETRSDANYGRTMMLRDDHDRDYDDDGDHDDHDHDQDVGPTTRPLKTLELFPIKEKISLSKNNY